MADENQLHQSAEAVAAENEAMLERLAELKGLKTQLQNVNKEFDELKERVAFNLKIIGSDKTKAHAGIYVTISHEDAVIIGDPDLVAAWLEDNVMDVMDYYKLNPAAIKAIQAETLADSGELIPGVQVISKETPSVREAKK